MSPAETFAYLEGLPDIARPYGLVVAVQENGLRAPVMTPQSGKNREELVRLPEQVGAKVELWPSA